MRIALRAARVEDFDYCKRLYFGGMEKIIKELRLDRAAQDVGFDKQWELMQVRIITFDGSNIGWLQSVMNDVGLFIAQIFVDGPFQRKGVGTEVINRLIGEATKVGKPVHLGVAKINPAVRLYQRLGFRITHEDERKFYMKRDLDTVASTTS